MASFRLTAVFQSWIAFRLSSRKVSKVARGLEVSEGARGPVSSAGAATGIMAASENISVATRRVGTVILGALRGGAAGHKQFERSVRDCLMPTDWKRPSCART